MNNKRVHKGIVKRISVLFLKFFLWFIGSFILLIVIVAIALQFSQTQKFLTQKITTFLSGKIKSRVELARLSIVFPKSIELNNLYIEDLHKDTLLYSKALKIDIDLWDLLSKKIVLNSVEIEKLTGHIYREYPDTNFNYSFITAAFSSGEKDTAPKQESGTPWEFSLKSIQLQNIYFTYLDTLAGINAAVRLGSFQTSLDEFDLQKKRIHLESIQLQNTIADIIQTKPVKKEENATEPFDFELGANKIEFSNVKANYASKVDGTDLRADLAKLLIDIDKIDIKNEIIALKTLSLSGTSILFTQNKMIVLDTTGIKDEIFEKPLAEAEKKANWKIRLNTLDLKNNSFGFENLNVDSIPEGMDFNHLLASGIDMDGRDIDISSEKISLVLNQMKLVEKSGFKLKKFSSVISYDPTHIELGKLDIQTDKSHITNYLGVSYKSIQEIKNSIGELEVNVNLEQTSIAMADVLIFVPDLLKNPSLKDNRNTIIHIDSKIDGTIDDLSISKLELSLLNNTKIKLKGILKKIRDPKNMYADLSGIELKTTRANIYSLLSEQALPATINIPETININADFKGYLKNFNGDIQAKTSIGELMASVSMNPAAGNIEQKYIGKVTTNNFDLGSLLKQPENLGSVTMEANIVGTGLDTSNLNAQLDVTIQKVMLKKYEYSDFALTGTIKKTAFVGKSSINDKNLVFNLDSDIDINTDHPKYNVVLDLKGADLGALNLTEEDIKVSTVIKSDLNGAPWHNITGKASVRDLLVIKNNVKYTVDSIVLVSSEKEGLSDISLKSEIVTADFNGKILMAELPVLIKKQIDSYINISDDEPQKLQPQQFTFEVNLIDPTIFSKGIIPNLKSIKPFSLKGEFDSEAYKLIANLNVPQIIYSGIVIDSLQMSINSDREKLNYSFKIASIADETIKLENLNLGGNIQNNNLSFQLNTAKDDKTTMLAIGGVLKKVNIDWELKLNPELNLNNTTWAVDPSNSLQFTKQGLIANNVIISGNQQSISINSLDKTITPPLEIKFDNFDISTISKIIERKEGMLKGVIDGTVVLKKENNTSGFTSDIVVKKFAFKNNELGNINLHADNYGNAKKFNVKLNINGSDNDIDLTGYYIAGVTENNLDFLLDIKNLNIASVEPYTFGNVTQMSGSLNGKLNITGKASDPDLNGALNLKKTGFKPSIIDSYLKVDDGKLVFDSKKVKFESFTLLDTLNNKAVLSGYVDISNLKDINFDIHLKTDNFLALNTTQKDNPLYYGTVYLDSDIGIKGNKDNPKLKVKAKLNKGSKITYVKPEGDAGKNESEGIVEFIDTVNTYNSIMVEKELAKVAASVKGLDLDATIEFDKNAELKIIVDPVSGDSVYVKGTGVLEFSLDPAGKTSLTGKYSINDGGYHLSIGELVKKDFKIASGSYITWTGDVTDAYVDLKAIYSIKTSPIDLLEDQIAGLDELQKNKYRNLVTFDVYLKMLGFISSPQISFDIQLPPKEKGVMNGTVNAKLNEIRADETQLNKQVFALLTINRFVGEDPLDSGQGATGISSTSRKSASRLLTQHLSNLSAKYIKGVDVNVGVNSYEDYSSGKEEGRTQLQLGVSKQLLNEKVTVQVGGNVDIEGEKAKQNNASDIAGNISVEYKLTNDGRYKLKGFRQSEYENPIEGELIKTGVGVMYTKDYNNLKELLFIRKKNRNKK
ncbi:MAG: translocation/assembly module TamB domain-containing protein [Bacteroidota bacterium]